MAELYLALLGWLPLPLQIVGGGIIAIFFILTVVRLVQMILDLIPFL